MIKNVLDAAEEQLSEPLTDEDRVFKDNTPNKSWVYRFVERNSELSARTPEHLGYMRKQVSKEKLLDWFEGLKEFLRKEHNLDAETFLSESNAHRIFNLDETGFPLAGEILFFFFLRFISYSPVNGCKVPILILHEGSL